MVSLFTSTFVCHTVLMRPTSSASESHVGAKRIDIPDHLIRYLTRPETTASDMPHHGLFSVCHFCPAIECPGAITDLAAILQSFQSVPARRSGEE